MGTAVNEERDLLDEGYHAIAQQRIADTIDSLLLE